VQTQLLSNIVHLKVNQEAISDVFKVMNSFFSIFQTSPARPERGDDNRLLKKLRLALLFWFISFIVAIIWFSFSPAF
jgi:hypothetical protein